MLWACTDWQIDWTAVAAGVALGIWLVDLLLKRHERHAAAKVLAQLILIELQTVSAYLHGFATDLQSDKSEAEQGEFDYKVSEKQEFREQLLKYVERFKPLDLRRLAERVDVLPASFSFSLSLFFADLNSVVQFLNVIGSSPHNGVHFKSIPVLREMVASANKSTDHAMRDASHLSKAPLMLKWRMRLRHGKTN